MCASFVWISPCLTEMVYNIHTIRMISGDDTPCLLVYRWRQMFIDFSPTRQVSIATPKPVIYIAANWISKAAKSKAPFESSFCMHGRSPWLVGDISLRYPQIVQAYLLDNFYKFYLFWKFRIVPHKSLRDISACFIGFFYKNGEFWNIRKGIPFSLKTCIFRRRIIYPAIAETTPRSQGRHPPLRRKESPACVVLEPVTSRIQHFRADVQAGTRKIVWKTILPIFR